MADDWSQLERLADRLPDAGERAARAVGEVGQKATLRVVRRRTGRLAGGIAGGLRLERTPDGATATIQSGVDYDAPVNKRFGHWERGRAAAEVAQNTAERAYEEELGL